VYSIGTGQRIQFVDFTAEIPFTKQKQSIFCGRHVLLAFGGVSESFCCYITDHEVMLAQFEVEGRAIGEDIGMQDGAPWPEISTVSCLPSYRGFFDGLNIHKKCDAI